MSPRPGSPGMILDACVLIDFVRADPSVLALIVRHVGSVGVPFPVVEEVADIHNEDDLLELGVIVFEPDIRDAYEAVGQSGPLSFPDWLCLLSARRLKLACVTNDKALRRMCSRHGVGVKWGLELLAEVHKAGGLTARQARQIAETIHAANPRHITREILARFTEIIRRQKA